MVAIIPGVSSAACERQCPPTRSPWASLETNAGRTKYPLTRPPGAGRRSCPRNLRGVQLLVPPNAAPGPVRHDSIGPGTAQGLVGGMRVRPS